jgi:hypothetical protein
VLLFLAGGALVGNRPAFDASGGDLASYLASHQTRIQVACALFALAVPLLAGFLVTVVSLARARVSSLMALACGLVFLTLFLADCTALVVSALRPNANPAVALRDFELLAMGVAAPSAAAMLLALGRTGIWPRWLSGLSVAAAALYMLRVGTLFATDGAFAPDGFLGIKVPVAAIASWWLAASLVLVVSGPCSSAQQSPPGS